MSRVETNTLISWLSHPNCTPQRHFENHSYCLVTSHFWELGCLNANLLTHTLCTHIYEVHKLVNSIALTLSSVCYGAYSSSYYKLSHTNLTLFQLRGRSPLTPGISQSLPLFRSTGSCRNMVRMATSTSCLKCLPLDLLSPILLLERPCLLTGSSEPGHLVFEPNMWWSSQWQQVTRNNPRS